MQAFRPTSPDFTLPIFPNVNQLKRNSRKMNDKDMKKAFDAFDVLLPILSALLIGSNEWSAQGQQIMERLRLFRTVFVSRARAFVSHDLTALARDMRAAFQKLLAITICLAGLGMLALFGACGPVELPVSVQLFPLLGVFILIPGRWRIYRDARIRAMPWSLSVGRSSTPKRFRDFTPDEQRAEKDSLGLRPDPEIDNDPKYNTAASEPDPVLKAEKQRADDAAKAAEKENNHRILAELEGRSPFCPLLSPADLDQQLLDVGADVAVDASPVPHLVGMVVEAFLLTLLLLVCGWKVSEYSYTMSGVSPVALYLIWFPALLAALLCVLAMGLVFSGGTEVVRLVATVPAKPVNALYHAIASIPWGITFANAGEFVGSYTGQLATALNVLTKEGVHRFRVSFLVFVLISGMPVHWYSGFVALLVGATVGILHQNLEAAGISTVERRKKGAENLEKVVLAILAFMLVVPGTALFARNWLTRALVFVVTQVNVVIHFGHVDEYKGWTDVAKRVFACAIALAVLGIAVAAMRDKNATWMGRWGGRVAAVFAATFFLNTFFDPPTVSAQNLGIQGWLACPVDLAAEPNVSASKAYDPFRPVPGAPVPGSAPPPTPAPPPSVSAPVAVGYGSPSAARLARRSHRRRRHDGETALAADVDTGSDPYPGTVACDEVAPNLRVSLRAARACHD